MQLWKLQNRWALSSVVKVVADVLQSELFILSTNIFLPFQNRSSGTERQICICRTCLIHPRCIFSAYFLRYNTYRNAQPGHLNWLKVIWDNCFVFIPKDSICPGDRLHQGVIAYWFVHIDRRNSRLFFLISMYLSLICRLWRLFPLSSIIQNGGHLLPLRTLVDS